MTKFDGERGFTESDYARTPVGTFTHKRQSFPELRIEATREDEMSANLEAELSTWDCAGLSRWRHTADRKHVFNLAQDENLDVAAAAQSNSVLSANDLQTLIEKRLLVAEGALANPNIGGLAFETQSELALDGFREERIVAAGNRGLHVELLTALTRDEERDVRAAARETLEYVLAA